MKNYSKRNFLKTISSFGVFLVGANLPIWASNNLAYAASSFTSYNLQEKDENDLMLLEGFKSRVVAITGKRPLRKNNYKWPKSWWPGTVSNRRHNPFQDSARDSVYFASVKSRFLIPQNNYFASE